jgi:hypothetical protein
MAGAAKPAPAAHAKEAAMYTVVLIVWLVSGETDVITLDQVQFDTRKACIQAAPYMARLKQRELPPMKKGKARCVKAGDAT